MLNRRHILGALLAAPGAGVLSDIGTAFAAGTGHNAPFDFSDPYDGLAAYAKVRGRLDGGLSAFW